MICKPFVCVKVLVVLALVPGISAFIETLIEYFTPQANSVQPSAIEYSIECDSTNVQNKFNEMVDNEFIYYSVIDLEGTKNGGLNKRDIKSYGFESCHKYLDESRIQQENPKNNLMFTGLFYKLNVMIPFKPHDKYTANIASVRDVSCCTPKTGCLGCYETSRVCFMRFYSMSGPTILQEITQGERICNLCLQKPCDTGTCKNGEFADGPMRKDPDSGIRIKPVICTPCEEGTWNTCQSTVNCNWNIPEDGGAVKVGSEIYTISDGPLWKCYPCESVKTFLKHYAGTSLEVIVDKKKTWICPGGNAAPRNCRDGVQNIVRSEDWSKCQCKEGFYGSESTGCEICPTGHYCVDGVKFPCNDHTYQQNTGATSCEKCSDTGDARGNYNCGNGKQLRQCLSSIPGSQNQPLSTGCVSCYHCKRQYITPLSGQIDCYRS